MCSFHSQPPNAWVAGQSRGLSQRVGQASPAPFWARKSGATVSTGLWGSKARVDPLIHSFTPAGEEETAERLPVQSLSALSCRHAQQGGSLGQPRPPALLRCIPGKPGLEPVITAVSHLPLAWGSSTPQEVEEQTALPPAPRSGVQSRCGCKGAGVDPDCQPCCS